MIRNAFPIDFIRQVIEQTLLEESIKDTTLFGGKNQVNLFSFYEQLQKEDEINRYVEIYRDLTDQQNRSGLIMNGTIIAPENPTITNLYSHLIIPMSFTCTFRVKLGDRDNAINTINNLIKVLKGKKQDVALFDNGTIFKVGTLGSGDNYNNKPVIHIGDYIGEYELATYNEQIETYLEYLINNYNFSKETIEDVPTYYYAKINNKLVVVLETEEEQKWQIAIDNGSEPNIVFPQDHDSFEKFKISMSFDSIRCDEPRNLNANEYCVISFGGSATLVDMNTRLGNDLVKVGVAKYKVKADPVIEINGNTEWLEPLEQPSSNSANTMNNLLKSSNFLANTHTDSLAVSRQYTFVADYQGIVNEWYNYARYGTRVDNSSITYASGVSPNLIYKVKELISQWGNVKINTTYCKIIESIDIENTESDVESVVVPLQVQGDIKVYDIVVNIENGSFTGITEIEPNQTRTITLTPFTNYKLPTTITVIGATYTYDSTSGEVVLTNPTGSVSITAECSIIIPMPVKGDIITFTPKSDNVVHRFRVLTIGTAGIARVMDLTEDTGSLAYNLTNRTGEFQNNQNYQTYYESNIVKYLRETYFPSLKEDIQNAISMCPAYTIQGNNIKQSAWSIVSSTDQYDFRIEYRPLQYKYYKRVSQQLIQISQNRAFAIDIDEIIDYFGIESGGTLQGTDLIEVFGKAIGGVQVSMLWTRSASADYADCAMTINHYDLGENYIDNFTATNNIEADYMRVRPWFYINLNYVDFEIEE